MAKLKYHNIPTVDVNVYNKLDNPLSKNLLGFPYPELVFSFKDLNEIRKVCNTRTENQDFSELSRNQPWILDYVNAPDPFQVNSLLFRSDEFKKEHDGKHILFSGCSNSYGASLYNHEIWPWIVYNQIKEKEKVSGYYNLSMSGIGPIHIVSDIFKYIDAYSKPDVIFINLPHLGRFYSMTSDTDTGFEFKKEINLTNDLPVWRHAVPEPGEDNNMKLYHLQLIEDEKYHPIIAEKFIYVYQYLMMLETFCKINNIQLYIYSHNLSTTWFLNKTDLTSFRDISTTKTKQKILYELMNEYMRKNKKDKFALTGRDGIHEGTAFHYAWSKLAYLWYKKDTDK